MMFFHAKVTSLYWHHALLLLSLSVASGATQQVSNTIQLPLPPVGPNQNGTFIFHFNRETNSLILSPLHGNFSSNNHDPKIEIRLPPKSQQHQQQLLQQQLSQHQQQQLGQQSQRHPYVSLDEKAANNTVVAGLSASDEDGSHVSLAIEQGNELQHFKLVETKLTTTIQVNGAPLSRANKAEYNLTIVARDSGYPVRTSTANLVIKLTASQQASPNELLSSTRPSNDYMHVGKMLVLIFFAFIGIIMTACCLVRRPSNAKKIHHAPPARNTSTIRPSDHCLCLNLTDL